MSCRVLGLGVEHTFLRHIIDTLEPRHDELTGRIIATSRNIPVRNLYRDNGFACEAADLWRLNCAARTNEGLAAAAAG